jgi:hypothetical protein
VIAWCRRDSSSCQLIPDLDSHAPGQKQALGSHYAAILANREADYHGAIEAWLARHGTRTVFCFVQFEGVALDELPKLYLARPSEIAERLRATAKGRGDSILYEEHAVRIS